MEKTFLFYDLETTGLNPCFDQIIQFAAIRTDLELRELDRIEYLCRLRADVVPSPEAFATHQIDINQLNEAPSEFEVVKKIHELVNQPGTISLGYNTLSFDDEMLRLAFYRYLLAPYTHQYAQSCQRMDLYPMVVMYALYNKEHLTWPVKDDRISLKLADLAASNGCEEGQAHDAMSDVLMTINLAKLLRRDETMWNYLLAYFNKATDEQRQQQLSVGDLGKQEALFIQPKIGYKRAYQVPVMRLGQHQHYKNQSIWLHLDRPELRDCTEQTISEHTWIARKRLGEPGFLLPTKDRFMQHLSESRLNEVELNRQWLADHPDMLHAIADFHCQACYPDVSQLDDYAGLYQVGFWQQQEQVWMQHFHQQTWQQRADYLSTAPSSRLYQLALRVIAQHAFDYLSDDQQQTYLDYMKTLSAIEGDRVRYDFQDKARLTWQQAQQRAEVLLSEQALEERQREVIQTLVDTAFLPHGST